MIGCLTEVVRKSSVYHRLHLCATSRSPLGKRLGQRVPELRARAFQRLSGVKSFYISDSVDRGSQNGELVRCSSPVSPGAFEVSASQFTLGIEILVITDYTRVNL